ncbi:MAG: FAD-binding oxidoreductase, partial [Xanthobacteraceae bacterium]
MRHITIVGGGQAGLLLALGLRQHGHQVRLVQNRSAEDMRSGKVLSSQCVFQAARAHERALGLDLWADSAPAIEGMRVQVAAPDGSGAKAIGFEGRLSGPAQSVDQRVKFPEFLRVLAAKGGTIELHDVGVPDLERYAGESDLVVVAAGKADV